MPSLTEHETALLKKVKEKGTTSPRELEEIRPTPLSAKEARIAIQGLLSKGQVEIDNNLKIVARGE